MVLIFRLLTLRFFVFNTLVYTRILDFSTIKRVQKSTKGCKFVGKKMAKGFVSN